MYGGQFFFSGMGFKESNLVLIYILGVLSVAVITGGKVYSLAVSLLVVLLFNFFFTEPYFSLFSAPGYLVTFVIMLAAAVVSSTLTGRVKKQAALSARKAYRTGTLLETSRKLQGAGNEKEILAVAAEQMGKLLERTIVIYACRGRRRTGTDGNSREKTGKARYGRSWRENRRLRNGCSGTISMRAQ